MLLCVGDSLTYGMVGYSYIRFLNPRIRAVNKGINGDTTRCALRRLERCLCRKRYEKADTCVISIGINDLLLPYLTSLSPLWHFLMEPRRIKKLCVEDDDAFRAEYEKYLKLLAQHHKKAVLIGLPLIQLEGFPHTLAQRRNAVIAELAEQYGAVFIDVYGLQSSALSGRPSTYSWKPRSFMRVLDAAVMAVLPFTSDLFSKTRGLELTVDGVHYNSVSARLLGEAVNKAVLLK